MENKMDLDQVEHGTLMELYETSQKTLEAANQKVATLEAQNKEFTEKLSKAEDALKKRDEADAESLRKSIVELAKDSIKPEALAPKSIVELRAMFDGMKLMPTASPVIDKIAQISSPRKASDSLREDGWNGGLVK